jgi:antirestriction protein ArdC
MKTLYQHNLCQQITEQVIAELNTGVVPWRKPWDKKSINFSPLVFPQNAETGKFYGGANIPILWMKGHISPYWGTRKMWSRLKATLNGNERSTKIFYKNKATHEVFNLEQVRGCEWLRTEQILYDEKMLNFRPAEELIRRSGATINYGGTEAIYQLSTDTIFCPPRSNFRTVVGYYTTILHELVHWSGHPFRLDRQIGWPENTKEYRFEELVGEFGACFLAAMLGLPDRMDEFPNQVGYLAAYIRLLGEDENAIFSASGEATKAVNYLTYQLSPPTI